MDAAATRAPSNAETQRSAVRLATVAHGGNLDAVVALPIEEHAVIAAPQPESGQRRFELLHVPAAAGPVAVDAVQNLQRRLAFDGAQVGAGFGRPMDLDPFRLRRLAHCRCPNSRRISSCGMPSPRASDARARSSAAAVSGVSASSSTGARASERSSGSTNTSSRLRTAFSLSAGNRSSSAWACWRSSLRFGSMLCPLQPVLASAASYSKPERVQESALGTRKPGTVSAKPFLQRRLCSTARRGGDLPPPDMSRRALPDACDAIEKAPDPNTRRRAAAGLAAGART